MSGAATRLRWPPCRPAPRTPTRPPSSSPTRTTRSATPCAGSCCKSKKRKKEKEKREKEEKKRKWGKGKNKEQENAPSAFGKRFYVFISIFLIGHCFLPAFTICTHPTYVLVLGFLFLLFFLFVFLVVVVVVLAQSERAAVRLHGAASV